VLARRAGMQYGCLAAFLERIARGVGRTIDGRGQKTTDGKMDDGQRMPLSADLVDVRSSDSRRGGHQHPRRVPTPGYTVPQMRRPSPRRIPQSGGLAHANGHVIGRRTRETLRGQDWCKGGQRILGTQRGFPASQQSPDRRCPGGERRGCLRGSLSIGLYGAAAVDSCSDPAQGCARRRGRSWLPRPCWRATVGSGTTCCVSREVTVGRHKATGESLEGPLDVDQR
jgi:hypothetical protein